MLPSFNRLISFQAMIRLLLIVFVCLSPSLDADTIGRKPLMCYVAGYAVFRPEVAKFTPPDMIDAHLCTHIIYAHLSLAADSPTVAYADEYLDTTVNGGYGLVEKMSKLKETNPSLKILFSLGGWEVGSVKFSKIAESDEMRKLLAEDILRMIKLHNFDGVDMNWMYPNHRGGKQEDVTNYILLLKEIRRELEKEGYLLVAHMSGNEYIFKTAYDLLEMSRQLDYVLLITYDYHGFWDGKTGVFAPLQYNDPLSVSSAVEQYLASGVPKHKVLMGFATHGRTFLALRHFNQSFTKFKYSTDAGNDYQMTSEEISSIKKNGGDFTHLNFPLDVRFKDDSQFNSNYFGIPSNDSFSILGTKEKGFIGFNEICEEFKKNDVWTRHWDVFSMTPFATSGRKLISYEDQTSFKVKMNYLKGKELGGAFVWSLDTDDFRGHCYGSKFPLTSLLRQELGHADSSSLQLPSSCEETSVRPVRIVSVALLNVLHP